MEGKLLITYDFNNDENVMLVSAPTVNNELIILNEFYGEEAEVLWELLSGRLVTSNFIS